jgi:hypothetical protein
LRKLLKIFKEFSEKYNFSKRVSPLPREENFLQSKIVGASKNFKTISGPY